MKTYPEKATMPHIALMLQAFAEGGTGTAGAAGGTGDGALDPAAQGETKKQAAGQPATGQTDAESAGASGAEQSVEESGSEADANPDAEFEEFMKRPEMKKLMDQRIQRAVKSRFKSSDQRNATKDADSRAITDFLAARYGVKAGDTKAILDAVRADTSYDKQKAEEMGMTEEAYREMMDLRSDNARLKSQQKSTEESMKMAMLRMEGEKLTKEFPDFDLDGYLDNPKFRGMLDVGIDMRSAYIAMNHSKLMPAAVRYTQRQTEDRVTETIRANKARPAEGGAGGGKPAQSPVDIANMSDEEFKAFRERVRRGDVIPL